MHSAKLIVLAVGLTGLTACSASHTPTASGSSATVSTTIASSGPTPSTAAVAASGTVAGALASAALTAADLPAGYSIALMDKGDQVTGQSTLDSCSYHYTSEAKRVARRQYVISRAGAPVGASNELVAYDSAADAAAALGQFRTAVAHCPRDVGNDLSIQVLTARTRQAALPVPDNETVTFRQYDDAGHQEFDVMIFQRHGRYLDGVYVGQATAFSPADLAAAQAMATATGKRLSALG